MNLESLAFVEDPGKPGEWRFDRFTLSQINLIVGINASGKSRLLNVISSLGKLLSGAIQEMSFAAKYEATFKGNGNSWDYLLESDSQEIVMERLTHNGKNVMQRGKMGLGQLDAEDVEGKVVRMRLQVAAEAAGHSFQEGLDPAPVPRPLA